MTIRAIAAALLLFVSAAASFAAEKPDFTGDWKVNVAKSDFGQMPAPTSSASKIQHKDPSVVVNTVIVGDQGEFKIDATYSTDGKETTNKFFGDNEIKSVAKWEGATLVIDSKGSFNGDEFTVKEKWTLSADGKVLTRASTFSSSQGEGSQTQILEKQ